MQSQPSTWITIGEAAERVGLSPSRLRQLDAELRPQMIGGRRLYDADEIERVAGQRACTKFDRPARKAAR